jgi:hypothetical protein
VGVQSERLEKKLLGLVETAAKAFILELDKELRIATPVNTGHARASWIPSVGHPITATIEGKSPSLHDAGVGRVLSYKIGDGALYISNAAPYVRCLNDGWSDQAPALFIEASIDRAMSTIKAKLGVDFGQAQFRANVSAGNENLASAYSPFADD